LQILKKKGGIWNVQHTASTTSSPQAYAYSYLQFYNDNNNGGPDQGTTYDVSCSVSDTSGSFPEVQWVFYSAVGCGAQYGQSSFSGQVSGVEYFLAQSTIPS